MYAAYLAWLGRQRPTRDVGAWALGLSLAMLAYVNALFHFTNSAGLAGETWRSGPAVLLMVAEVLYAARFLGPRHTLVICGAAFVFGYLRAYTVVRDAFVTPNEQFGRIVQTPEVWAVVFETWTMVPLFLFVLRDYFVTKSLAQTDGLTGLLNHRAFYETLGQLLGEAQRSGQPLSLLLVDVDHFKAFNDRFGHRQGDQVLQTVAALLMTQIRWTDGLFRYGGEEFAVLLPDTGHAAAMAAAAHLVDGRPERRLRLLAAGLVAGAVNAVPEAFMMYLLDGVPALRAVLSAAGNTAVHGLLLGSLPLALLPVDWLHTFLSVFAGLDAPAANADERTTPRKGSTPRG